MNITTTTQLIQLVNDDAPTTPDSDLYVLFAGNPASLVTTSAPVAIGAVATAGGGYTLTVPANAAFPATPFTIQFLAGSQNPGAVLQVTAYDPASNQLTTASGLPNPPAVNDTFVTLLQPCPGVCNLAMPTISVSTVASGSTAASPKFTCALLTTPAAFEPPVPPFPILFQSGQNKGTQVSVATYDSATGLLTTAPLPNNPAAGDAFVVGAVSQPLSSLPQVGTLLSSLSGQTQNIYQVAALQLASGVAYLSKQPLTYFSAAPAIDEAQTKTFQTVELTTGSATTSDLTAIDYYGLPIQIESINQNAGNTTHLRTWNFKDSTIASMLQKANATLNTGNGLYLGPGQIAAANKGNPSPFRSFGGYLQQLAGNSTTFTIAGSANFGAPSSSNVYGISLLGTGANGGYQSTYSFSAAIGGSTANGFVATLTPIPGEITFTGAPDYFPEPTALQSITVELTDGNIYGAVLDSSSFQINLSSGSAVPSFEVAVGSSPNTKSVFNCPTFASPAYMPSTAFQITFQSGQNQSTVATVTGVDSSGNVTLAAALPTAPAEGDTFAITGGISPDLFTLLYTNTTFSWAVADLLSALNFGFVGSTVYPGGSQQWYAAFPQAFPYGLARGTPNDHCYNPWADVIYKASDAYGFAFSDRIAPSPLMGTNPTSEYLRITRLPQEQIDAPLVTTTKVTDDKIHLTWPAESGVTYTVTTIPPVPTKQIALNSSAGTALLKDLSAGTPYQIAVQGSIAAQGSTGRQSSRVLPLTVCTTGTLQGITGAVSFQTFFNWSGTTQWPTGFSASINGTQFPLNSNGTNSGNVSLSGGIGDNYYAITINDPSGNLVYSAIMRVTFSGTAPNYQLASAPTLYGSNLAVAVQPAPQSYPITTVGLVLGIPFDPIAQKSYGSVA